MTGDQPRPRRVTQKDIARAAGVTVATVSLVLRGKDKHRVRPEKRDEILAIAKDLNYRPNHSARSLAIRESRTIGLVITTLANPFYSEIAQDIILRATEKGYGVIAASAPGGLEDEERSVNDLIDRGVDGLVLCSALRSDPVVSGLCDSGIPFVLAMRTVARSLDEPPLDHVGIDNRRGAYLLVEHLIRMGHERIALLTGDLNTSTGFMRLEGARAAMKAYGLALDPNCVLSGDFHRETGRALTRRLLAQNDRPGAIVAHSDHMAVGVLESLQAQGLRVPEDVALVGFDDIEMAGLPGIELTTISQTKSSMGKMAVDILVEKIQGRGDRMVRRVILDPILMIRNSCGFRLRNETYAIERRSSETDRP
jgi:LacI family transcriptional regulator, galactose operon repressor